MSDRRIYVRNGFLSDHFEVGIVWEENGQTRATDQFVSLPVVDGQAAPIAMCLSMTEGQRLIDQLWDCGLRPSEGSGSAGQLAATQKHLEDMRTLTVKLLPGPLS